MVRLHHGPLQFDGPSITRTEAAERCAQLSRTVAREYRQAKVCEQVHDLPRIPHKGRSVAESALKPVKRRRIADDALSTDIRRLLIEARNDLAPYGWSVHVEEAGKTLSFEFRNPLSPVSTGMHFDADRTPSEVKKELDEHFESEPEFARTKLANPPRRKRELIGGLRWAATSYGWSRKVFQDVIDTLRHFHVLSDDEWTWLNTVGPDVLPKNLEREWRKRIRLEQRRRVEKG